MPRLPWADIERWLADLTPADAGAAFAAAGLRESESRNPAPWSLRKTALHKPAGELLGTGLAASLRTSASYPMRLSVPRHPDAQRTIRLLLQAPGVAAATVRPAHAGGRAFASTRPADHPAFPVRIGMLDRFGDWRHLAGTLDSSEATIGNAFTDNRPWDLLVIPGPLAEAAELAREAKATADAVVVLDPDSDPKTALARLRTATKADWAAQAGTTEATLPENLVRFVDATRNAEPLDVALTSAFDRDIYAIGVPRSRDDVPRMSGEEPQSPAEPRSPDEVPQLSIEEATARLLQCTVGPDGTNTFVAGINTLRVWVGPPLPGSLVAPGVDYGQFADSTVELTVSLVPLQGPSEPVSTTIRLPAGYSASTVAVFALDVADSTMTQSWRLLVIHGNRIVQTALLDGRVGATATLTDLTLVRPDLRGLTDRPRFDLALVANHDGAGNPALTAHRDGTTTVRNTVGDLTTVKDIGAEVRAYLDEESAAAQDRLVPEPEEYRTLLVNLARSGHALYLELLDLVDGLEQVESLQLVTASPGWFIPLEFVYPSEPPDDDAQVCPDWLTGDAACGGQCLDTDSTRRVCPGAFWGLSRTIERHYRGRLLHGSSSTDTVDYLTTAVPVGDRDMLQLGSAACAASRRVDDADCDSVGALLPDHTWAADWDEWVQALQKQPRHLLVLMPHTQQRQLEIGGDTESASTFASAAYLTGGHPDLRSTVLMLGCQTAGHSEDPAGYAKIPLLYGAAVVVTSLSALLNRHAAEYTRRLVTTLTQVQPSPRPFGDVLRDFRRETVAAGLPTALAITAYGDADWRL